MTAMSSTRSSMRSLLPLRILAPVGTGGAGSLAWDARRCRPCAWICENDTRDSRGQEAATATEPDAAKALAAAAGLTILKTERMSGGQVKVIMKNEETGELSQEIIENA